MTGSGVGTGMGTGATGTGIGSGTGHTGTGVGSGTTGTGTGTGLTGGYQQPGSVQSGGGVASHVPGMFSSVLCLPMLLVFVDARSLSLQLLVMQQPGPTWVALVLHDMLISMRCLLSLLSLLLFTFHFAILIPTAAVVCCNLD